MWQEVYSVKACPPDSLKSDSPLSATGQTVSRPRPSLRRSRPERPRPTKNVNIGIIGSGNIGAAAARLLTAAGHSVAMSNSRGPETLQSLVADLRALAHAATVEDAAKFGELVLIAIPFISYKTLPSEAFVGKIVIDAENYYPQRDGNFPELDADGTTSSELLAVHLPKARVIKAFNTIRSQELATETNTLLPLDQRRAIFVAGDDAEAKRLVMSLIEQIGFGAVDSGTLAAGGRIKTNYGVSTGKRRYTGACQKPR
jgi:predicted dinucleotide-binding enzyme